MSTDSNLDSNLVTDTNSADAAAVADNEVKTATIRPGYLVSVTTTIKGGVTYERIPLDASGEVAQEGAEVTRWETKKIVLDPVEYKRATTIRSKARSLITRMCQATAFGPLCPEDRMAALVAAARQAKALIAGFNVEAKHSEIGVFVMKGRVASSDAEAAQAITAQIADLVVRMDTGIKALDAKAIRKAAAEAARISAMLDDSLKAKAAGAIAQARKAARDITRRITKGGEDAAIVLADVQRGQIESARIAFLDLSADAAPVEPLSAVDVQRFVDLDMGDDDSDDDSADSDEDSSERAPVVPRALDLAEGSEPIAVAAASANVRAMELV